MKRHSLILLCFFLTVGMYSCKKSSTTSTGTNGLGTMTATVNDSAVTFDVQVEPTLIRSTADNQKRFDFTGISKNQKYRLTLTIGEETSTGNDVTHGDHLVQLFNDDDPNTPQDESIDADAFFTLGITLNNGGGYLTDADSEKGKINVSTSSVNGTTGTMSGTFNGTLMSLGGGTDYTITSGVFTNIKYTALN